MYIVLRSIRGIVGLIAGWQILGLLPAIGWLSNLGAVPGNTWDMIFVQVFIKVIVMLVFGSLFFGIRVLINKLHAKQHGVPHPALTSKWSL